MLDRIRGGSVKMWSVLLSSTLNFHQGRTPTTMLHRYRVTNGPRSGSTFEDWNAGASIPFRNTSSTQKSPENFHQGRTPTAMLHGYCVTNGPRSRSTFEDLWIAHVIVIVINIILLSILTHWPTISFAMEQHTEWLCCRKRNWNTTFYNRYWEPFEQVWTPYLLRRVRKSICLCCLHTCSVIW